jgi:hypothetical protein
VALTKKIYPVLFLNSRYPLEVTPFCHGLCPYRIFHIVAAAEEPGSTPHSHSVLWRTIPCVFYVHTIIIGVILDVFLQPSKIEYNDFMLNT